MTPPLLISTLDGDEWSASRPGRLTSIERAPETYCMGRWVGPRAGLETGREKKSLDPAGTRNPAVQPIAHHFNDTS
jgi:hypothetical protein